MVEDLILRMELANMVKQERVKTLSERKTVGGMEAENGGTGF